MLHIIMSNMWGFLNLQITLDGHTIRLYQPFFAFFIIKMFLRLIYGNSLPNGKIKEVK